MQNHERVLVPEVARGIPSALPHVAGSVARPVSAWWGEPRHINRLAWCYLAFHVLVWTLLPALSHKAPPWDNIEQLVWIQSLEWGYYKHPPFPTWWMVAITELLGRSVWVSFFAAQLSVGLMMLFTWRLALMVTTPARAFAALVLSSLMAYHGLRGIMANHNTLQLMPVGWLLWACLSAIRYGGWWRWASVGAAAAVCFLSKYSALVWFAIIGVAWLMDSRMRSWKAWRGVALAVGVMALLITPHLLWLVRENFPTLGYAHDALDGAAAAAVSRWETLWYFVSAQIGRVLPMVLALLWLRPRLASADDSRHAASPAIGGRDDGRFVQLMAWGPLLLTLVLGVLGVNLMASWATTFFVLWGLMMVLRYLPQVQARDLVRSALVLGVTVELLLSVGLALGRGVLVDVTGRAARSNFPAPALAKALDDVWHQHEGEALKVLVGETWLAGNVSLHLPSQPLVLLDGDRRKAPWVSNDQATQCNLLVLVDRSEDAAAASAETLSLLMRAEHRGRVSVPWTSKPGGPQLTVDWGIVLQGDGDCNS